MSLGDVKFQSRAQDRLHRAVLRDRVPHAYLFHGPDGVGKETLATRLAQLLLCDAPIESPPHKMVEGPPPSANMRGGCGRCENCRLVRAGSHPDVHIVYRQLARQHPDPAVRKRTAREIGVDVIRHFLVDKVHLTPTRERAKVFVVRQADRITEQAQNALLKTLEEPPGTTYLILLTASIDRMLLTTLSRCQIVEFDALPTAFVREKLGALHPALSRDQLDWYARNAEGSLGQAVQAVALDLWTLGESVLRTITGLGGKSASGAAREWIASAESIGKNAVRDDPDVTEAEAKRVGLKVMFRIAADWYAEALRARVCGVSGAAPVGRAVSFEKLDTDQIVERINRLAQAERHLDRNVHVQLCVETLLSCEQFN